MSVEAICANEKKVTEKDLRGALMLVTEFRIGASAFFHKNGTPLVKAEICENQAKAKAIGGEKEAVRVGNYFKFREHYNPGYKVIRAKKTLQEKEALSKSFDLQPNFEDVSAEVHAMVETLTARKELSILDKKAFLKGKRRNLAWGDDEPQHDIDAENVLHDKEIEKILANDQKIEKRDAFYDKHYDRRINISKASKPRNSEPERDIDAEYGLSDKKIEEVLDNDQKIEERDAFIDEQYDKPKKRTSAKIEPTQVPPSYQKWWTGATVAFLALLIALHRYGPSLWKYFSSESNKMLAQEKTAFSGIIWKDVVENFPDISIFTSTQELELRAYIMNTYAVVNSLLFVSPDGSLRDCENIQKAFVHYFSTHPEYLQGKYKIHKSRKRDRSSRRSRKRS